MKIGNFDILPKKKKENNLQEKISEEFLLKIPLTEEELNMPLAELSEKYDLTIISALGIKKKGYRLEINWNKFKGNADIDEQRTAIANFKEFYGGGINLDQENKDKSFKNNSWLESYLPKEKRFNVAKTTYPRPFIIQMNGSQYGILKSDGLYFTNPEDFEEVKNTFYNYEWLTGEMDNRTASDHHHYDRIHVDHMRETLTKIDKLKERLKKINPQDFFGKDYNITENNSEDLYNEFQDYLK